MTCSDEPWPESQERNAVNSKKSGTSQETMKKFKSQESRIQLFYSHVKPRTHERAKWFVKRSRTAHKQFANQMHSNVDGTANMHCAIAATECKQRAANWSWSVFRAKHKGFLSRHVDGILQLKYVRKPHGRIPPLSHFIWAIFSVSRVELFYFLGRVFLAKLNACAGFVATRLCTYLNKFVKVTEEVVKKIWRKCLTRLRNFWIILMKLKKENMTNFEKK